MIEIASVVLICIVVFAIAFVCGILYSGIRGINQRPRATETPKVENTVVGKVYTLQADTHAQPGCTCSACTEARKIRKAMEL